MSAEMSSSRLPGNSAWNASAFLVNVGLNFFILPFALLQMGAPVFGVAGLVTACIAPALAFSNALALSTTRKLAQRLMPGQRDDARRFFCHSHPAGGRGRIADCVDTFVRRAAACAARVQPGRRGRGRSFARLHVWRGRLALPVRLDGFTVAFYRASGLCAARFNQRCEHGRFGLVDVGAGTACWPQATELSPAARRWALPRGFWFRL